MVGNVIKQANGRYNNDIKQAAQTIREALCKVQQKTERLVFQTPGILFNAENSNVHQELMDLASYSADILQTLSTFFHAHPPAAKIFHYSHLHHCSTRISQLLAKKQAAAEAILFGLPSQATQNSHSKSSKNNGSSSVDDITHPQFGNVLATFYEHSLIPAYRHVLKQKELGNLSEIRSEAVLARIQLARQSTISAFRSLLNFTCLSPLLEGTEDVETGEHKPYPKHLAAELAEDYMHVITACLSERHFILDYIHAYTLRDDLEIIQQIGVELDPMRVQYLFDGIDGLRAEADDESSKNSLENQSNVLGATALDFSVKSAMDNKSEDNQSCHQTVAIDSLISQVRDLLPNLGEGFVQACLEYFDNSPEQVINTLLEENLPPHLANMDRNMPKKAPVNSSSSTISHEGHQNLQDQENMTSTRLNIFDSDEFDINVRDNVDMSKIHRGKQRRAKNANALLDDKRDLKTSDMRERFSALSIVVDEEIVIPGTNGGGYDYDDEYDDTYDDQAMGEKEPDANELESRRPFVLPQALGGGHKAYVKEEESDEEIENEEEQRKKMLHFTRNPEEVRQEAERKRQEKLHSNRADKAKGGSIPNRDVIGRAKGQGQEKKVVINRKHKTENKGKRTRAAADHKMSKGMF